MRQTYFPPLLIRLQYGQANFQGRFAPPSVMRHWLIRRDGFTEIFELYFERPLPLRALDFAYAGLLVDEDSFRGLPQNTSLTAHNREPEERLALPLAVLIAPAFDLES